MMLVGKLIGRVDSRVMIGCGFALLAAVTFHFTGIDLDITRADFAWPNVVMGLSLGFIFVPLTTTAMGGLAQDQMGNASGIFNLMRNIGGGIGISIVTTMISRGTQAHQSLLSGNMSAANPRFVQYFQGVTAHLAQTFDPVTAKQKALGIMGALLGQQASLMAYIDNFRFLGVLCLVCIPGAFILRKAGRPARSVPMH
jgi:DHA2 family multidrug resistance protein